MARRGSAAFVILVLAVSFLMLGGLFTMIARPWDAIVHSQLFTFETKWGKDYASWQQGIYTWVMLFALISYLLYAIIRSRRATP